MQAGLAKRIDRAGDRARIRWSRFLARLDAVPLGRRLEALYLAVLAGFMLTVRSLAWPNVAPAGGRIGYIGTDAYYHLRHSLYAAANFPATLPFDLFTNYPLGTRPGPYGSPYDVAAAGLGLMLGGGEAGVALAGAVLPPLLAVATLVALYLLARRLFGPLPAAVAALALALSPGLFLTRTLPGAFDHHAAEALLSTAFAWALVRALDAARTGLPGDLDLWAAMSDPGALRPLLRPWLLAAVLLALYLAVWPPGLLFVAIAATALLVAACHAHLQDRDPRVIQWTSAAALGGAAVLLAPFVRAPGLDVTDRSWLQPLAALLAGLFLFAAGEALAWARARALPRWAVPAALLVGAPLLLAAAAVAVPAVGDVWATGLNWAFGLGEGEALATIAEGRSATLAYWLDQHGLLLLAAAAGAVTVAWGALRTGDAGRWLVVVWTVVVAAAAWNQVRFGYYLAVVVALLAGALLAWLARLVGLDQALEDRAPLEGLRDLGGLAPGMPGRSAAAGRRGGRRDGRGPDGDRLAWRHVLPVVLVLLLAVPGHVVPAAGHDPAWDRAARSGPGDVRHWEESLLWMRHNTPPPPFDLATTFEPGQGMPDDAAGVLAWWDYGHWITAVGHRIPVANPFQQNAPFAAAWLTNGSEAGGEALLDVLGGEVRYVVIDDETAAGKYGAVAEWADAPYGDGSGTFLLPGEGVFDLPTPGPSYAASRLHALYGRDADGLGRYRLVHESPRFSLIGSEVDLGRDDVVTFNRVLDRMTPEEARDRYGDLNFAAGPGEPVEGTDRTLWRYDHRLEATVKVFERVAGARIQGTAPPGDRVVAQLDLVSRTTDRAFTYTAATVADEEGRFVLVVPYATSEHVPVAAGGTAYTVHADGLYQVTARTGGTTTVVVPDRTVLDGGRVVVNLA